VQTRRENQRTIRLTDCTLRDGSYQNNFGFTALDTAILSARLDQAGFPEIEVGHGLGLMGALRVGSAAAATDAEYIDAARASVKHARLGVFAIPGIATPASVVDAARRGIDILKIGVVAGNIDHGEATVKLCRDNGVVPCVFFMQSSLVPADVLADNAASAANWGCARVYVVDSAGFMMPDDVTGYVSAIRARADLAVGFHGHNNLHMAMANVVAAVVAGADSIDCTLRGLGRSSGNPQTEAVALVLSRLGYRTGIDIAAAIQAADEVIGTRFPGYGNAGIDLAAGFAGLHSRFVDDVNRIAEEYGLQPIDLLLAVGERGQATDRIEILVEIARSVRSPKLQAAQ
jgi:4-hydroxy 2-oxovalerate aldolase/long-chain acyl-CoA synthetase